MELLVATLAYTRASKDTDMLARIRLIADTVRTAPGLMSSRFYRGRESEPHYLMLTTWESEESWQQSQARYSPKRLLLGAGPELLSAMPEQWQMHYLWGYSRPSAPPILAAAHMASIHPEQAHLAQRGWIEGSRRLAAQPLFAFAFLARGTQDEDGQSTHTPSEGSIFLHLLSWASETDRDALYADPNYQATIRFMTTLGIVRVLPLEPM